MPKVSSVRVSVYFTLCRLSNWADIRFRILKHRHVFRFVSSSQVIFFLPINFWWVVNYLRSSPVVATILTFCKMSICRLIRQEICRYTLVFVNSQWETEKCLHTSLHTSHVSGGICIVNVVSFGPWEVSK